MRSATITSNALNVAIVAERKRKIKIIASCKIDFSDAVNCNTADDFFWDLAPCSLVESD
jgi:hypothetical protein